MFSIDIIFVIYDCDKVNGLYYCSYCCCLCSSCTLSIMQEIIYKIVTFLYYKILTVCISVPLFCCFLSYSGNVLFTLLCGLPYFWPRRNSRLWFFILARLPNCRSLKNVDTSFSRHSISWRLNSDSRKLQKKTTRIILCHIFFYILYKYLYIKF